MRRTLLAIVVTATLTSACWYVITSLRRGAEGLWLMSTVKAPGRMALNAIENDLAHDRCDLARLKMVALLSQWEIFEYGPNWKGEGIGNIMVTFSKFDRADGSQMTEPIAGPNRSPAAGSR